MRPSSKIPLSDDQSLLRTTLLGSLLDVAAHNCARGMVDFGLFEIGTLFVLDGDSSPATGVREHRSLAVLLSGRTAPATWGAPDPPRADVFAVKGVLEALGAALRLQLECRPGAQPFLHPGRSATVLCDGRQLGWLGELHPLVAREWGIESAAAMELQLDLLLDSAEAQSAYRDVISYPALRQDLAVVLAEDVAAAKVLDAVRDAAGALLDDVGVFDVYSGPQVGEGRRSLACRLPSVHPIARSPTRTWRPCASGSSPRWPRSGVSCVPELAALLANAHARLVEPAATGSVGGPCVLAGGELRA